MKVANQTKGRLVAAMIVAWWSLSLTAAADGQGSDQGVVLLNVGTYLNVEYDSGSVFNLWQPLNPPFAYDDPPDGSETLKAFAAFSTVANTNYRVKGELAKPKLNGTGPEAPGVWTYRVDSGSFATFPNPAYSLIFPPPGTTGLVAEVRVKLVPADGGGGSTYTNGTFTLTIEPS
ncbi:MAG: hypothetical protein D6724_00485 [Armatimonadetes bacterium]|nr:MAG: hypothetical protein D6724_00485 [Armatimonadota bacterium]